MREEIIKAESLIKKYKEGKASKQEIELLKAWFSTFSGPNPDLEFDEDRSQNLLNKIHFDIAIQHRKTKIKRLYKYGIAASIALAIATTSIYLSKDWSSQSQVELVAEINIPLDHTRASIELPDGSLINLDELDKSAIDLPGVTIDHKEGLISFINPSIMKIPLTFHTIHTPIGGEYVVILPDGSQAKLNANSSIKFPNRFENVREVEIQGEVFFQVKRDPKKKFVVNTNHQILEVLGTSFNVKSYLEDKLTTTALESGSLKVSSIVDNEIYVLQPGQIAVNGLHVPLHVKGVRNSKEKAWRTGEFYFDGENLEQVLNIIARWYDVTIKYEFKPSEKASYAGVISRDKDLNTVLSLLEGTEDLKFEIIGKEVLVKKSN